MTTLTRDDANRAVESATSRRERASADLDCWSRVIAHNAVLGGSFAVTAADDLLIARAVAFEARADCREASERWQEVTA